MECTWDAALLQIPEQLPPELLQVIQTADPQTYLETIAQTALDARYTYTLFAHCEDLFPHVCSTLRLHGSLPSALATLGRVVPFAPYLMTYATRLLETETHDFASSKRSENDLLYLLGLFRLLAFDHRTIRKLIRADEIAKLLQSRSRPIVYLAIRILQIHLSGADKWFEDMIKRQLGEDAEGSDINGLWDDKIIDYRFLTMWEEDRFEKVSHMLQSSRHHRSSVTSRCRILPSECFHSSTALVAGTLLPRSALPRHPSAFDEKLITTPTTTHNLHGLASALKRPRPILLKGLPGSGKTLIVKHIAQKLGKLESMVTLHLNEQSDAKLLTGIYTTGDTPGSFVWKAGVLTTAVQEGRWVLIEDLDRAPQEIIGALLPLIEKQELVISNRKDTIYAAQGFKIIATIRRVINHKGNETNSLHHMLGARHWQAVSVSMAPPAELQSIATHLYSSLSGLLPQFLGIYERLKSAGQRVALAGQSRTAVLRSISPRDLFKWCTRVNDMIQLRPAVTSSDMDDIFLSAIDCFVGALPDSPARGEMAAVIAEELRIDPQRRDYLLDDREVRYESDKHRVAVGRYQFVRKHAIKSATAHSSFSINPHTSRMLERVAAAAINREPLLLIGETGVGKTTAVQHLANDLGKKLVPFNLSQQSVAGDLLGGFKPVSIRSLIIPLKDEFDVLFTASFSLSKNQQFLELLGKQLSRSNWSAVCKVWREAFKMVDQHNLAASSKNVPNPSKKRKIEPRELDFARWDAFREKVTDIEQRLKAGDQAFAFSFVEGNIVQAARNGDWVLLDEINLASPDTLESIADLFDADSPSLLLAEAGNPERIDAHPDFRIFAAMNPATDVGKKDLPPGIRSRFTEIYVDSPDKDLKSLQSIVRSYLRHESAADQAVAMDTSLLYQKLVQLSQQNKLVDGAGQMPHFSLRTLTRTLSYAKYIAPLCNLRRALYEGFQMSFLTLLDMESAQLVQPLLEQHLFGKRVNIRAELQKGLRKPNDGKPYLQGFPGSRHWIREGDGEGEEQPHYILTPFIRSNLENLVRATSTRQFPILIQGPTSSGKTSMIEYLAKRTGHKFVRINNHEHTDLQEYLGTYASDAQGRLHFQEGLLVQALRHGHWIVLDELNLAPTDVLEALNRLLDDNRELLIPETQEVVRPHENFMLFATQNPAGLYGGRKTLSRAFRNRFLELHFDDIPIEELQEILHRRTQLPESRCKRIVTVYRELSALRQENRLFEQKSFATLRDLFRWALRPNDTIEQLASNGFMLLAERVRKPSERQALKEIIEKAMSTNGPRVIINEAALYAQSNAEILHHQRHGAAAGVVWTKAMRRLYILVSRAIQSNEPVLLVGDTGCGKTTVCQILAHAFDKDLYTVNAHQNTETGDFIGSQRPVRNRAVIEATLRHQLLSMPLLQSLDEINAYSTDALLDAYDNAISSLQPEQKKTYSESIEHLEIQATRTRFKALFEWSDGALVHAMKSGSFFLLDEISLADDSVLERINSVLESARSILLAEKGSLESFVTAAEGFQFFATMNPGGDYGKKELSPALRNRFTEIWVPPLDEAEDIEEIIVAKLADTAQSYAHSMVSFAQWFNGRYNTSASTSISIRDALAWVNFVNMFAHDDLENALVNGAAMVYVDTLGANPAGLMALSRRTIDQERAACLDELSTRLGLDAAAIYSRSVSIEFGANQVTVGPYSVPKKPSKSDTKITFSFRPLTTQVNFMRVARAMQVSKPILMEGSPGVGKTALITALAQAASTPLTRINLSEQTDLLDLFGSDQPLEDGHPGSFAWRDAPFLRAMKKGEWVLLDELNLASQSVLEGLNACLDHRGEVFVPELGQTFSRHPDFRLFAAQNPHHQGGGRKGLPASFVNRFTVVFADAFGSSDLQLICRETYPEVNPTLIEEAVQFVESLETEANVHKRLGSPGAPSEFNLRDLTKLLSLASVTNGLLRSGSAWDFVEMLFSQRFRSHSDREFVAKLFTRFIHSDGDVSDLFPSLSPQTLQIGVAALARATDAASLRQLAPDDCFNGFDLRTLQALMICVRQTWPVILTGPSGSGKTALVENLASMVGATVVTLPINAETDAMDLLGGYEQADPYRHSMSRLRTLRERLAALTRDTLKASQYFGIVEAVAILDDWIAGKTDSTQLTRLRAILAELNLTDEQAAILDCLDPTEAIDQARFEWIDGILIEALQEGKWVILDNANLCSPSVLDRLNSLLEHDGVLAMNEHSDVDGEPRIIRPHADFRVFVTMDPRFGELSRAMRNRAVELHVPGGQEPANATNVAIHPETAIARLRQTRAFRAATEQQSNSNGILRILNDHLSIQDARLIPRFNRQLMLGLYALDVVVPGVALATPSLKIAHHSAELRRLYNSVIDHLKVPTDFAYVQTFHPLNNKALVSTSQQAFHTACSLALSYEAGLQLESIEATLASIEGDPELSVTLSRVERSLGLSSASKKPKASSSKFLSLTRRIMQSLSKWIESKLSLPWDELHKARKIVQRLCGFAQLVLSTITGSTLNVPTSIALLVTGHEIFRSMFSNDPTDILSLQEISDINQALSSMVSVARGKHGRACTLLWTEFKFQVPSTSKQFEDLLNFEKAIERFDMSCHRLEQPLDALTDLRLMTSRTFDAATPGYDLEQLTAKFDNLIADPVDESASDARTPHFSLIWRSMCEHFSVLLLDDVISVPSDALARMAILAQCSTKTGIDRYAVSERALWQTQFGLLAASVNSLTTISQRPALQGETHDNILRSLQTTARVPIGRLDLFDTEVKTLGASIASHAHLLEMDELRPLDQCLEGMLVTVLEVLATSHNDTRLQELARLTLSLLDKSANDLTVSKATQSLKQLSLDPDSDVGDWLSSRLREIVVYLRSPHGSHSHAARAAAAWASFGCVCLQLYTPRVAFDPALELMMKRELFQIQHQDLSSALECLKHFRTALTGTMSCYRSKMLEDDIRELGPEPSSLEVYRPTISQIAELQPDLNGLMRTVETIIRSFDAQQDFEPLDEMSLSSLLNVRVRLAHQHRVYDDFKLPVVGFIDCLLTAHRLASRAQEENRLPPTEGQLSNLLPFAGGSLKKWMSDEQFITARSVSLSQEEGHLWLRLVALRSSIRPLSDCSSDLRMSIQQHLHEYYIQWRKHLNDEQRKTAAKSSLYKFKGQADEQEPTQQDLDEYFPVGEALEVQSPSGEALAGPENLARSISTLHRAVFLGRAAGYDDETLHLLREVPTVYKSTFSWSSAHNLLPALILLLTDEAFTLSNDSRSQTYDFYRHPNVSEIKRLLATLGKATKRFRGIHEAWPEHATPTDVLRLCDNLSGISHCAALPRFIPTLEKLHGTLNEWQKIASREYSAAESFDEVTSIIIRWRQLELSSWSGLFQHEKRACETSASSWWYIAYEAIFAGSLGIEASEEKLARHVEDLLKTLGDFLTSCGLGEFSARLQMLQAFEAHLQASIVDMPQLSRIYQALSNVISYYKNFESAVSEALSSKQKELEKQVHEVVKIASWKDRNIDMLRQSAQSSHKRLLRLVRKYRRLLAEPVETIVQGEFPGKPDGHDAKDPQFNVSPTMTAPTILNMGVNKVGEGRSIRYEDVRSAADAFLAQASNVRTRFDGAHKIHSFAEDLASSIRELRAATPSRLTEENKALVNHLKTRKRRLLADVLKELRQMGFRPSMSQQALQEQSSTAIILSKLPSLNTRTTASHTFSAQYELHRLLSVMPKVRQSVMKPSDDLTAAEVGRCTTLLESILQIAIHQFNDVATQAKRGEDLNEAIDQIRALADCQDVGIQPWHSEGRQELLTQVTCLEPMLQVTLKLLELQQGLSGKDYSKTLESIRAVQPKLNKLRSDIERNSNMPPNLVPANLSNGSLPQPQARMDSLLNDLETAIDHAISINPELSPVTSQLKHWMGSERAASSSSNVNGSQSVSLAQWTEDVLATYDVVLGHGQHLLSRSIHNANKAAKKEWLLIEMQALSDLLDLFDMEGVTHNVKCYMSQLEDLQPGQDAELSSILTVLQTIRPVLDTYRLIVHQLTTKSNDLCVETSRLGYSLATSFIHLATNGFCTPSDKSETDAQQSSTMEAGTGLGDGDGAEDISKDIADDEDLSEAAQGKPPADQSQEMEQEKDAVDMADEEMEGYEDDDEREDTGLEEDGADKDSDAVDDVETESVHAGDDESVLDDEKTWEGAPEENQSTKEADKSQSSKHEDDLAASKEGADGEDEQSKEADEAPEDDDNQFGEDMDQSLPDPLDREAQEGQAMEMPEDIKFGEADSTSGEDSDLEGLDDEPKEEPELQEPTSRDEDEPVQEDEGSDGGEGDETREAAAGAGEDDENQEQVDDRQDEDVLMSDPLGTEVPAEDHGTQSENTGAGLDSKTSEQDQLRADQPANSEGDQANAKNDEEDQQNQGSGRQNEAELNSSTQQTGLPDEESLPFKQLGDALKQWYRQKQAIKNARAESEQAPARDEDIDMANTRFEHLPNDDSQHDAQALGATSTSQSAPVNEENALPKNEEMESASRQSELQAENQFQESDDESVSEDEMALDPTHAAKRSENTGALEEEANEDTEMDQDQGSPISVTSERSRENSEGPPQAMISLEDLQVEDCDASWAQHEENTRNLAFILTEHLRLILQPTQATKLRGDFRTGKRLNIKRIIPYIASSYKRDKIWMRRSVPSKRSYQVMLAIDDSKSMAESQNRHLAFDTLALITRSMSMLEVGELSVVGFGEQTNVVRDFSANFTAQDGDETIRQFTFAQGKTNVRKLLETSIELFRLARLKATGASQDLWQLQLIISDGICEDHPSIRQLVRQAHEERIMIVFIVVDAPRAEDQSQSRSKQSVLDLQTAEFVKDASGEMQLKMVKYLDTFPFQYYLIVRDVQELPGVLAGALRQWFAEVMHLGG